MPTSSQHADDPGFPRRTLLGGIGAAAVVGLTGAPAHAVGSRPPGGALSVVVRNTRTGGGLPLVGYNTGHYLPGSNTSAWLAYSRVNAVRFFALLSEWTPDSAVDPGDGVESVADFDARKAELRRDPENTPFLRWDLLEELFENHVYSITNHYRLNYQVSELRRLGIAPIMQAAELRWNSPWSGLWQQWQKHYAFTYHLARHYDVERYNFVNEPDHPSAAHDIVDQDVYVRGLQIASDAIRCAIADVNARTGSRSGRSSRRRSSPTSPAHAATTTWMPIPTLTRATTSTAGDRSRCSTSGRTTTGRRSTRTSSTSSTPTSTTRPPRRTRTRSR